MTKYILQSGMGSKIIHKVNIQQGVWYLEIFSKNTLRILLEHSKICNSGTRSGLASAGAQSPRPQPSVRALQHLQHRGCSSVSFKLKGN